MEVDPTDYKSILSATLALEKYLKDAIEKRFPLTIKEMPLYDLEGENFVGMFVDNKDNRYTFVIGKDGTPVLKPV